MIQDKCNMMVILELISQILVLEWEDSQIWEDFLEVEEMLDLL